MIKINLDGKQLNLKDPKKLLSPADGSQLAYLNFHQIFTKDDEIVFTGREENLERVTRYLLGQNLPFELNEAAEKALSKIENASKELETAIEKGSTIKAGDISEGLSQEFLTFIRKKLPRKLLPHQEKAALHMLSVPHSANFSVPGSGKSSVVLSVFAWLKNKEQLRSIFVIGPRSCFEPWQNEYKATLGKTPRVQIIAGGSVDERLLHYYVSEPQIVDLYLTTYQTLSRDSNHVVQLISHPANNTFLVIDEAHYIKQPDGIWANSVLQIARAAKKRCVLTGTPFPKSYADGVNIFEVLYPETSLFTPTCREGILRASDRRDHEQARQLIEPRIDPLYYRVRKEDLNLSDPVHLPPILVEMKPLERELYNTIVSRIRELTKDEVEKNFETIQRLRKGRIMRIRQVTSHSALLLTAIEGYKEDLFENQKTLDEKIARYDQLETPGKIDVLLREINLLKSKGEKVVVWSNFIGTLERIQDQCERQGWKAKAIYGAIPSQKHGDMNEETRSEIIEEFKHKTSGLDILIANPATCAESVSLHKTCSNAIYYDLSYNCAEYLQSIDRIHRVGGSETKKSYYRYLHYDDTVESAVLDNITHKAQRMSAIIDRGFPLGDIDLEDMELTYEQVVG